MTPQSILNLTKEEDCGDACGGSGRPGTWSNASHVKFETLNSKDIRARLASSQSTFFLSADSIMNLNEEEEDEIAFEVDVSVASKLDFPLTLIQSPLRPPWRPYDYEGDMMKEVRVKPNVGIMEFDMYPPASSNEVQAVRRESTKIRKRVKKVFPAHILCTSLPSRANPVGWNGNGVCI